ncbi:hypothetical protein, partial [Rhabdonatronobacter sediminivivens]|uniref:hypothetical protein n=1 Tax=Rhabdonatronobacter sediminivivens TaxID=2743469 RepID=UPI001F28DFA5
MTRAAPVSGAVCISDCRIGQGCAILSHLPKFRLIVITDFRRVITFGAFLPPPVSLPLKPLVLRRISFKERHSGNHEGTGPVNIHEYQAKGLLRAYGAPVADGRAVL